MCPRRAASLCFIVLTAVAITSPASAWTRTVVKSADAVVEVRPNATVEVLLRLDAEVHAGWLRELELAGLGADLELDRRRPPFLRSEDGEIYRPETEVTEDGSIRLWFERREAPRKGEYRVHLRYRTRAEAHPLADGRHARLHWSLPAWETGLHEVSVDIRAPRGAFPAAQSEPGPGVEIEVTERPRVTQLKWRRIHLPRHTPWLVAFDVPKDAVSLPPAPPVHPVPAGFEPLPVSPEEHPFPWALGLLAFVVLAKRRAIESQLGPQAPLLRASWTTVVGVALGLLGVGALVTPQDTLCAIPLIGLALHRPAKPASVALTDGWQGGEPTCSKDRPRPADLLDATTPIGAALLTLSWVSLALLDQPLAAMLLLPVFFVGTRQHTAPRGAEATRKLRRWVSRLRLPEGGPPIALRWESARGEDARCRVLLPSERPGLMSLAFVVTTEVIGPTARRKVVLLVETRAQSDADDLVRRRVGAHPDCQTEDGRNGRLVEWQPATVGLLRALACRPAPEPVPRASTGTWLLREAAENQREAA